ncbi:cell division protein [Gammaproteobacteria bacterium 45_16_T64]|nr:cell division protein [Gammaproteobacteria bacterium 45_16_T64]
MNEQVAESTYAWRFYIVVAVMLCAAFGVAGRVVYLYVVDKDFLQHQGDKRVLRTASIPAHRGLIKDRNNEPLAVSTPVTTIWANPKQLIGTQSQWPALAKRLGTSETRLRNRILSNQSKQFIYLRRHMTPQRAGEVLKLGLVGVHGLTEYRRYYPAGEVAAHLVGFTNIDEKGQEGIELAYDQVLRGTPGKKRVVKDLHGRVVKDIGLIEVAQPGQDIRLSIDLRAQYLAYRELLTAVKEYKASAGTAVALDIETGEVLAMVNQPSYNPNNRSRKDVANFRNRALTDLFEPGSTVKPFTVAAALESGRWKPESLVNTAPGFVKVGRKRIRDLGNYGVIDVSTILAKSSNVGVTKLALSLEPGAVSGFFSRLGLGQPTGVGFPGESAGLLPVRERWKPIEVATMSYGYGLSVTALQLAQAYAVLGSGGIKKQVSLLDISQDINDNKFIDRVVDEAVAANVVDMLEKVTGNKGTARRARVPGYRVAGKTGTVHKTSAAGGYEDHKYTAIFAGLAPVDNPRIALVVMVDDPKGDQYYGGQVAAPIFSRIMAGLLRVKQVVPDNVPAQWVKVTPQRGGST